MIKKAITSLCIVLFGCTQVLAQHDNEVFSAPFDFGLLLSGNFGELRSNHFHSGLDFKTQGVTGKPIRCVADGYISRASVQPGGYGLALYVMQPKVSLVITKSTVRAFALLAAKTLIEQSLSKTEIPATP